MMASEKIYKLGKLPGEPPFTGINHENFMMWQGIEDSKENQEHLC